MQGTSALERGIELLRLVAASDIGGASLVELTARSGLARSTAFRILDSLVAQGLLFKDAARRYHLGQRLYDLGMLASHRYDLGGYSFQTLRRLADELGDTVFLNRRVGLDMICVERVEGPQSVDVLTMTVGTRRPIGLGAGGVALLGSMDPVEADAIMAANHNRFLAYYGSSITGQLQHRVQIARRNGFAVHNGLLTTGVCGLGVAVVSPDLVPILSLSVVSTQARMKQIGTEALANILKQGASEISAAMAAQTI